MSESFAAARPEIQWEVNDGQVRAKVDAVRRDFHAATGAMSDDALRLAVSQEKLDKALARHGVNSTQAKQAELAYRREIEASTREVKQHERAVEADHRAIGQATRGVVAGSGAFRGFARSVAFASAGFLGAAGLTHLLRESIGAAVAEQTAVAALGTTLDHVGLSWRKSREEIEQHLASQVRSTGFTNTELTKSLTAAVRRTGDLTRAYELNALAADIARARGMTLEQVMTLLIRAMAGNARAATTLGLPIANLSKTQKDAEGHTVKLTAAQLKQAQAQATLGEATRRYGGQAAAYMETAAGKQALFHAELERTQEIIGAAVLPALTELGGRLGRYLDRLNRTGELQRDVNRIVRDGTKVAHGLADGFEAVRAVAEPLAGILGGTGNALSLLVTAVALRRIGLFARDLGSIAGWLTKIVRGAPAATAALEGIAAAEGEAGAAGGVAGGRGAKVGRGGRGIPVAFPIGGPLIVATVVANLPGASGARPPASDPHLGQPAGDKYPLLSKLETNHKWPDDVDDSIRDAAILAYGFYRGGQWTAAQLEAWLRQNPLAVGGTPERRPGRQAGAGGLRTDSHDRPGYTPPAGRPDPVVVRPPGKPLTAIQDARLRLARAGDNTRLQLPALRDVAAYDRKAIAFQEGLIRRGIGNAQEHAAVIEQLYGDLQQTEGQIDQIHADAAKKAQDRADARRKAEQSEYEATVRARTTELRTAARAGGPAADDAYTTFLRREAHDARLTREQRARYGALLQTELAREQAETKARNDRIQRLREERRQIEEQRIHNQIERAQLIDDPAKRDAAEKKAYDRLIAYERAKVARLKGLEREREIGNLIAAQAARKALSGDRAAAGTDFFAEAVRARAEYGANIDRHGELLSGQDSRGVLGEIATILRENTRHTKKTAEHTGSIRDGWQRTGDDAARLATVHGL